MFLHVYSFFFFNDTATTEIYTLSHTTLFRSMLSLSLRRAGYPTLIAASGPEALGLLATRSEEHTSELQSRFDLVCRLLLEKKKNKRTTARSTKTISDNRTKGCDLSIYGARPS